MICFQVSQTSQRCIEKLIHRTVVKACCVSNARRAESKTQYIFFQPTWASFPSSLKKRLNVAILCLTAFVFSHLKMFLFKLKNHYETEKRQLCCDIFKCRVFVQTQYSLWGSVKKRYLGYQLFPFQVLQQGPNSSNLLQQ